MAQSSENKAGNSVKILSVVWYKVLPPKFGGQKAVAFFNDYLGQEASLICLCSRNNETVDARYKTFPELPTSKWQFINPSVWRKIYLLVKKQNITHVILEFPYHGIAGFICRKFLKAKLIVNTHNIEFQRFKEQNKWWWGLLYHFEKWTLKRADGVFFKTIDDKATAVKHFDLPESKLQVIPYGVKEPKPFSKEDAQIFIREKHTIPAGEKIILFAATLDYEPNAAAVVAIINKIIPLLNHYPFGYKIVICGRNQTRRFSYLNKLIDSNLILAGEVEDVELYFRAADVFINPVASGGGIQTKMMDALAHHLNIVCFASKLTGIEHAGNKIYAVEDGNWGSFTSAIVEALKSKSHTSQAFFETYNWRTIAAKAYQQISSL